MRNFYSIKKVNEKTIFRNLITFCAVFLIFTGIAHPQQLPDKIQKREFKKSLRHLKKGKGDSIHNIVKIAIGLSDNNLKNKWRKRGVSTVKKAYPVAVSSAKTKITRYELQITEAVNDPITQYKLYNSIVQNLKKRVTLAVKLNQVAALFPKLSIEKTDVLQSSLEATSIELEVTRNKAAESLYTRASATLSNTASTKKQYQKAYYDLRQCLSLIPNYKDATSLKQKAQNLGTVRIRINNKRGSSNSKIARKLQFQIEKQIELNHKKTPFIAISTNMVSPDFTVTIIMEDVTMNKHVSQPIRKDEIKTIEKRENADDVQVKCVATLYQKYKTCSIPGMYIIRDKHGNKVTSNSLLAFYQWDHSYVTVSGDKRALSRRMKRHSSNNKDKPFPSDDDLINRAFFKFEASLERLFNQLHRYSKL